MIEIQSVYFFLLILARMTAFIVTVPVLSAKGVPAHFKVGLGVFISLIIFPALGLQTELTLDTLYILYVIQEVLLGLMLGWIAKLIFTSIQVAGSFIDIQIGFALANVIDPQTGAQSPVIGNFKYTFAILLFFAFNIHHLFIDAIISSFHILPIAGGWLFQPESVSAIAFVLATFSKMFVLAFKVAAPIVASLLLADVALGIVARTVPQLNVFVVGMPLKIIVNFILLFMVAPGLMFIFKDIFKEMVYSIKQLIQLMGS